MAVKAVVEALLRDRKLDRTLTSTLPDRLGEDAVAPLDSAALDRGLAGGLPRGQVSEVVGPASSGRTSVAWAALAAATRRGESVALIDTCDRFDPPTAHACGMDLSKLLWVRGQAVSKTPGTFIERVIDRAIKSLNLVVQSGVCTLVVIDLIDLPATALGRLPASTWFRVERAIEGSDTAVLILASMPVARSAGGRSIVMGDAPARGTTSGNEGTAPGKECSPPAGVIWKGEHDRSRRLAGVRTRASVNAARWSHAEPVDLQTHVINGI